MSEAAERTLGLDLGAVRIGLALSDPLGILAQPLGTLERVGARRDLGAIEALCREHRVTTIVVGLPLLLSGIDGTAALAAREFAERLRGRLPGLIVELWDERLTTVEAERTMIEGGARRERRRKVVDTLAAVLILQSWLDARRGRR